MGKKNKKKNQNISREASRQSSETCEFSSSTSVSDASNQERETLREELQKANEPREKNLQERKEHPVKTESREKEMLEMRRELQATMENFNPGKKIHYSELGDLCVAVEMKNDDGATVIDIKRIPIKSLVDAAESAREISLKSSSSNERKSNTNQSEASETNCIDIHPADKAFTVNTTGKGQVITEELVSSKNTARVNRRSRLTSTSWSVQVQKKRQLKASQSASKTTPRKSSESACANNEITSIEELLNKNISELNLILRNNEYIGTAISIKPSDSARAKCKSTKAQQSNENISKKLNGGLKSSSSVPTGLLNSAQTKLQSTNIPQPSGGSISGQQLKGAPTKLESLSIDQHFNKNISGKFAQLMNTDRLFTTTQTEPLISARTKMLSNTDSENISNKTDNKPLSDSSASLESPENSSTNFDSVEKALKPNKIDCKPSMAPNPDSFCLQNLMTSMNTENESSKQLTCNQNTFDKQLQTESSSKTRTLLRAEVIIKKSDIEELDDDIEVLRDEFLKYAAFLFKNANKDKTLNIIHNDVSLKIDVIEQTAETFKDTTVSTTRDYMHVILLTDFNEISKD